MASWKEIKHKGESEETESGPDEIALKVEGLAGPHFSGIDFELPKGRILGIAGLIGSGKTEIGRVIFNLYKAFEGRVIIYGEIFNRKSPKESIRKGVGLLPEDRKTQGLIQSMTLRENITLPRLDRVAEKIFIRPRLETSVSRDLITRLRIKTTGPEEKVQNLSGGNQQKVSLAKWLFSQAQILILEEPTRGVDIGAKAEIYQLMQAFINGGGSILLISSDLDELIAMCERILVINKGKISGRFNRSAFSEEVLLQCMC